MDRRLALVVLAAIGFVVLLASVATGGKVQLWHDASPTTQDVSFQTAVTMPPETSPTLPPRGDSTAGIPNWIGTLVSALVLGAVVVCAVIAAVSAWQHRPRLRWWRREAVDEFEVLPDIVAAMSADAAEQRAALIRGAPRNAIVQCWLRLEAVVANAGLPRDPADTSTEFTSRVLATYTVDRQALLELSALYREARFSTHEMGESDREAAIAALEALHHGLGSGVSA